MGSADGPDDTARPGNRPGADPRIAPAAVAEWFPAGTFPADRGRLLDIAQARLAPRPVLEVVLALGPNVTWDGPGHLTADLERSAEQGDDMHSRRSSHEKHPGSTGDTEWAREVADGVYRDPLVTEDGHTAIDEEDT